MKPANLNVGQRADNGSAARAVCYAPRRTVIVDDRQQPPSDNSTF